MKLLIALALIVVVAGGCEQPKVAPPTMRTMSVASVDTIPSLLQLAGWLAHYDMEVINPAESPTWRAAYPDSGSTVRWFKWQAETIVPASGVPPEYSGGSFTRLRILTESADRDSFSVRVAGIDSAGNQGPWSEAGVW